MLENVLLAPYTTFNIGGPARYFAEMNDESQLPDLVKFAKAKDLPIFVLSGGSGVLVSDKGFPGLVIKINNKGIVKNGEILEVSAGELWHDVVTYSVKNNLQGIECMAGIPGLSGSAVAQSIGAYGQEIRNVVTKVRVCDIKDSKFCEFSDSECDFAYRNSKFKNNKDFIITKIWLKLHKDAKPTQKYNVTEALTDPTLQEVYDVILARRKKLSTFYDKNDPDSHCTGSFFVHPIISANKFKIFHKNHPEAPYYKEGDKYKIIAGWLVEHTFYKNYKYKNTGLSSKHCLVITNKGGATAAEVLEFAEVIKNKVKKVYDIDLKPEVITV